MVSHANWVHGLLCGGLGGGCMEVDGSGKRRAAGGRGKNHDPVTRGSHSPILARSPSFIFFIFESPTPTQQSPTSNYIALINKSYYIIIGDPHTIPLGELIFEYGNARIFYVNS